jgi:hypothetical protein
MRALERAVVRAAIELVQHDSMGADKALASAVESYLSDDAVASRPMRESCGAMSPGWTMPCQRPKGHPLDSDRPHQGFDSAGRQRSWRNW